jgi:predicted ATPase
MLRLSSADNIELSHMPSCRLHAITIENFKSMYASTRIELGALTVFVGRNNSGKSTITQALLLLKQTLQARPDNPLSLSGFINATSLRELTSGWPDSDDPIVVGPKFTIEWGTDLAQAGGEGSLIGYITKLELSYQDVNGQVALNSIRLTSTVPSVSDLPETAVTFRKVGEAYECLWEGEVRRKMEVDVHHFLPSVSINRRNVGPRDYQRVLTQRFSERFIQPLDELEELLKNFAFLSSTRSLPPPFYPPVTSGGDDLGISGEFAAQLLWAHRGDTVHYFLPDFDDINAPAQPKERPLKDAINEVLRGLGIDIDLSIHEIEKVGFRLLFGRATLAHVGRGLTYLLPIVQLGLFHDPKRIREKAISVTQPSALQNRLCAFEEPEAHLHPRVQARLATWFVFLAQASRQVLVETHSDHLVRRLRRMAAEAKSGSALEDWLATNVRIVNVTQVGGKTSIEATKIAKTGSLEIWPTEFMDAAVNGEEQIYLAAIEKTPLQSAGESEQIEHHEEDEPNAGP